MSYRLLLLVAGLISYGCLLPSDYLVQDGHAYFYLLQYHHLNDLREFFGEVGRPWLSEILAPFASCAHVLVAFKSLSLLLVIGSAWLIDGIGVKSTFLNRHQSFLLALLALVVPAFKLYGDPSVFCYILSSFLFWMGLYLALLSREIGLSVRMLFRALGLICFAVSFTTQSCLVFYLGVPVFLILIDLKKGMQFDLRGLFQWGMRHLDFLILPLIVGMIIHQHSHGTGVYASYNDPKFSLSHLFAGVKTLIAEGVVRQANDLLRTLCREPLQLVALIMFVLWMRERKCSSDRSLLTFSVSVTSMTLFALALLVLGIAPYILVGREFAAYGWYTRNSLLLPVPFAILLLALIQKSSQGLNLRQYSIITPCILIFIVGCMMVDAGNVMSWQANRVKELAIRQAVLDYDRGNTFSVVIIRDEFKVAHTIERYTPIALTFVLGEPNIGIHRLGLEDPEILAQDYSGASLADEGKKYSVDYIKDLITKTTMDFALSGIDPDGGQMLLSIRPRFPLRRSADIAIQYWIYKLFQPEKLQEFINKSAIIKITELK